MKRRSKWVRILRWTSLAVAILVVAGGLGAYFTVGVKLDSITHIAKIDVTHRPHRYTDALNILLLGSDNRHGHNGTIGGRTGCNCSDTIMLVHISPGRKQVTVVSIPRDTMVPYYACSPWEGLPGQSANADEEERINATLAAGGPECVRETVEQQTGIYVNDVIELDFTGFEDVINDIGGVNICVPIAIHNVITLAGGSGLNLPAGEHHIWGRVALQFWRTRENIANGSDIDRIARDQYLLAEVVKGVLHSGLLHSPSKMYDVLGDVAGNLTTDASDTDLLHIATSLDGISASDVQFITAPWAVYPYDPDEVEFSQPQADALFSAIAHDSKLPKITSSKSGKKKSKKSAPAGSGGQVLTINPSNVQVEILNGSDGVNEASTVDTALTSRGFDVVGTGYAETDNYTRTVIQYSGKADRAAANTVKEQFSDATLQLDPEVTAGTIQVILGSSFTQLATPQSSAQAISGLSTDYGGITANVRCRNSAFYGYYDQAPANVASCAC
jgi:LCP family protein required for cell wall assembly